MQRDNRLPSHELGCGKGKGGVAERRIRLSVSRVDTFRKVEGGLERGETMYRRPASDTVARRIEMCSEDRADTIERRPASEGRARARLQGRETMYGGPADGVECMVLPEYVHVDDTTYRHPASGIRARGVHVERGAVDVERAHTTYLHPASDVRAASESRDGVSTSGERGQSALPRRVNGSTRGRTVNAPCAVHR